MGGPNEPGAAVSSCPHGRQDSLPCADLECSEGAEGLFLVRLVHTTNPDYWLQEKWERRTGVKVWARRDRELFYWWERSEEPSELVDVRAVEARLRSYR